MLCDEWEFNLTAGRVSQQAQYLSDSPYPAFNNISRVGMDMTTMYEAVHIKYEALHRMYEALVWSIFEQLVPYVYHISNKKKTLTLEKELEVQEDFWMVLGGFSYTQRRAIVLSYDKGWMRRVNPPPVRCTLWSSLGSHRIRILVWGLHQLYFCNRACIIENKNTKKCVVKWYKQHY